MVRLIVNDREQLLEQPPQSWGELLRRLEMEAAARGELVSAVRFDGVEDPTFHDPARSTRSLSGVTSIAVESATPRALLEAALTQGADASAALATAARDTGDAFRGTDIAAAMARLVELGDGVRSMVMVLDAAAGIGVSLDRAEWNGRPASAQLTDLVAQFESIIGAQQSQDWLTLADILEYELQPALSTARPVFETLRAALA